MWLTKVSIERPAFITMVMLAIILLGMVSYTRLGVDMFPNISFPYVAVTITYRGASPEDVENLITKPVEDVISSINNIDYITSTSQEGIAVVVVRFKLEANADLSAIEVQRKVDSIRGKLPKDIDPPTITKIDPNSFPIISMAIQSDTRTLDSLYQIAKDQIKDKLQQVSGVSIVDITGQKERQFIVEFKKEKLEAMGLSVLQVAQLLEKSNIDMPVGRLDYHKREITVRVPGELKTAAEFSNISFNTPKGALVYIKDIATVKDSFKEQRIFSRLNGKQSLGLYIYRQSEANTVKVNDDIQKVLADLQKNVLPKDIRFTTAYNQTIFTRSSLHNIQANLLEGIILTSIIILLFLHNFRNTMIVLFAIPTSLIGTFIVIYFGGFTLNMISMMGLALCIGILVDDSIVVLENIHRHLELGEEPRQAAFNGRTEIGLAAISITFVDIVVFIPIGFLMSGFFGQMFRQFAVVIVVATLLSLFVSFTLTPMLASRWNKKIEKGEGNQEEKLNVIFQAFEYVYQGFKHIYSNKLLPWALKHRFLTLAFAGTLFVLSFMLVITGIVSTEYMTRVDRGEFSIDARMPVGTSLEETDKVIKKLEEHLLSFGDVDTVLTTVGKAVGRDLYLEGGHLAQIQVKLKSQKIRKVSTYTIITAMQRYADQIPGLDARVLLIGLLGGASRPPLQFYIKGQNMEELKTASNTLFKEIKKLPGTLGVKTSYEEGKPEMRIIIDRDKAAYYGLTVAEIGTILRTGFSEMAVTKVRLGNDEYDVTLLLPKDQRLKISDVTGMPITTSTGSVVRLEQIATFQMERGPSQIERRDRSRIINVTSNLTGSRALGELTKDAYQIIGKMNVPAGVKIMPGGDVEEMQKTMLDLFSVLMLSIALIYMLMVALFESYSYPFIIMFSLPLAVIGAFAALALTGRPISMNAFMGIIMLMGLVAKNAILLVDYANTLKTKGKARNEALMESGATRLRPIMMTTFAMVCGMLPLAAALREGAEQNAAMGVVIIGGLISSLFLTLVVVPVVYTVVDDFSRWFKQHILKRKETGTAEPVITLGGS